MSRAAILGRVAAAGMFAAGPALAAHDGIVKARTGPELSDVALAIFAGFAMWFVRRAMRARFSKKN